MVRLGVVAAAAIVELGARDPAFALAINRSVIQDYVALFGRVYGYPHALDESLPIWGDNQGGRFELEAGN